MAKPRVLIVEDEKIVALDLKLRLESLGYGVTDIASSRQQAMDCIHRIAPDLVLMDIKLKGNTDGIDTAESILAEYDVPIIFVTAFTDENTLERAKRVSPYGYILKPYHERELRIAIELAVYKHDYERALRQAKNAAESASNLKSIFLSNISHELKTPLNSLMGFTDLALSQSAEPETLDCLAMIKRSGTSLGYIIDAILDYTLLAEGKLDPIFDDSNPLDLINRCMEALAPEAYIKGIELSWYVHPSVPRLINTDSKKLSQIIQALLENGIKYTSSGYVRIELASAQNMESSLDIRIEDTGCGIPEDKQKLLFSPFVQLDGSYRRQAGGTGIGLALSKNLADVLKGNITIESIEGKGTKITVTVPYHVKKTGPKTQRNAGNHRDLVRIGLTAQLDHDIAAWCADNGIVTYGLNSFEEIRKTQTYGETAFLVDEMALSSYLEGIKDRSDSIVDTLKPGTFAVGYRIGREFKRHLESLGVSANYYSLPFTESALLELTDLTISSSVIEGNEKRSSGEKSVLENEPRFGLENNIGTFSKKKPEVVRFISDLLPLVQSNDLAGIELSAKRFWAECNKDEGSLDTKLVFSILLAARKQDILELKRCFQLLQSETENVKEKKSIGGKL